MPTSLTSALRILIAICAITSILQPTVQAQSYTVSYDGFWDYMYDSPNDYLFLEDDEVSEALPIGFTFTFFGIDYTDFYISSNGFITFSDDFESGCCEGQFIPDPYEPNNLIALMWDDLNADGSGYFAYELFGTPGSQILVVTIEALNYCDEFMYGQIWLYEGSNIIELHTEYFFSCYPATQGIENIDGTEAYGDFFRNQDFWNTYNDYIAFIPDSTGGVSNAASVIGNQTTYCRGAREIFTVVRNDGVNTIDSLTVAWEWNGVPQTPAVFDDFPVPPGLLIGVVLDTIDLIEGDTFDLKVWTTSVNGVGELDPESDTISSTIVPDTCWTGGEIIYVDSAAIGQDNGTSWTNALTDLATAIRYARDFDTVDQIWIANGTYFPGFGSRFFSFSLSDSMSLYGGFAGGETGLAERNPQVNSTILSGDIGFVGDSTDNAYSVVRANSTCDDCLVDGVTIREGTANIPNSSSAFGGGVLCYGSLVLRNVILEENMSQEGGSAVHVSFSGADLLFDNCQVRNNTSVFGSSVYAEFGATVHMRNQLIIED